MIVTAAGSSESAPGPEVRAVAGVLGGSREAGLAVFRGVPYAAPPVGAVRFAAPGRCAAGRGAGGGLVRPAASAGRPVRDGRARAGGGGRRLAFGQRLVARSGSGAGLPVLLWIPGGGYVIGASSLPEFDGGRLAAGGVVVVTGSSTPSRHSR